MVNRKPEFILSLMSAILATAAWYYPMLPQALNPQNHYWGVLPVYLLSATILLVPVLIFEWIGTFTFNNHPRGWGIFFFVAGILLLDPLRAVTGGLLIWRTPKRMITDTGE
jgi:hypothetical protein